MIPGNNFMNSIIDNDLRLCTPLLGATRSDRDDEIDEKTTPAASIPNNAKPGEAIVFSSPASYHPLLLLVLIVYPIFLLARLVSVHIQFSAVSSAEVQVLVLRAWVFAIACGVAYGVFVPARFVVYQHQDDYHHQNKTVDVMPDTVESSVTIGVATMGWTWKFPHVTSATVSPSWWIGFRPRIDFATQFYPQSIVMVHRSQGGWLVLVSPVDPQGFIEAIAQANNH